MAWPGAKITRCKATPKLDKLQSFFAKKSITKTRPTQKESLFTSSGWFQYMGRAAATLKRSFHRPNDTNPQGHFSPIKRLMSKYIFFEKQLAEQAFPVLENKVTDQY